MQLGWQGEGVEGGRELPVEGEGGQGNLSGGQGALEQEVLQQA